MNKMFLSALACLAFAGSTFAGSTFASNELIFENRSESFFEYKYESITSNVNTVTNYIDIKCYMRACMYVGRKKACTEWVEISCEGADYSLDVEGDKKLVGPAKDMGLQKI